MKRKCALSMMWYIALPLTFLVIISFSCGSKQHVEKGAQPSLESLYQSWHTLATLRPENIDYLTALQLSQEMVRNYGDDAINKIFQVLEKPDEAPTAKMLAVMSLTPFVKPEWKDKLIPLTKSNVEVNSRVCAISLLSMIPTEEITGYLKTLLNDESPRVQFVVITALAKRDQPEGINRLNELWNSFTRPQDREHILLSIPPQRATEFLHLYGEGIKDENISHSVRREAILMLGRFGGEREESVLKEVLEKSMDADIKELAQDAMDAIRGRLEHSKNLGIDANLNSEALRTSPESGIDNFGNM
ncbi:MAG: HEAT repeat domain-containing protein [Candidatus Hydrogenedentes bacterium]|nr:HEAT repeat domain-containing protein [Candidatus Hydrogenedentota bacterium]